MFNESIKAIHTDITGAVTVKEVGKILNHMMAMRRPKYGCMVNLSDLPTDVYGRIQWRNSVGKKIVVAYEEVYATFTITGISRNAGCHDAYVTMTDGKGTYKTVLASTIKDKNLGRLFNRYIKYYYRLDEGDVLKIGSITDTASPAIKILRKGIKYDKDGIGHKAYATECTNCGALSLTEEYDLLHKKSLCTCHRSGIVIRKAS